MSPREWINSILSRHGLERPDGRQLFQYRVTDKEFENLASLLKTSTLFGLENITNMLSWDAAFVMYASEWWRRCYEGHWGWDGIFKSIGVDYTDLSSGRRNELVEMGLYRWRREVRVQNGFRRFLGTVATEGGLPLHQLTDSGGWLRNVLQPILKKHVSRDISIRVLIENYGDLIPVSYRSKETTQILSDIAETVVSLRHEHELMNKESPIGWLDSNRPNWRELFPLPIDDAAGKSLLSDLIDAASKAKADEHTINPFEVERFLIRAQSDTPELVAQLEMPTFAYFDSLGIDLSKASFPPKVTLEIFEPSGELVWPWCRGIVTTYRHNQALKLSGRTLKLSGLDATKELRLRFKSMGEIVHELDLINGGFLDTDSPWLFKKLNEKWVLHGVASQAIESDFAIAYIPASYSYNPLDDSTQISEYGKILSGYLLKISGTIRCSGDDVNYKLSAGVEESVIQYHLAGKRFSNGIMPSEIYLGVPRLIEKNSITGVSSVNRSNRLLAKPIGVGMHWQPLSQESIGFYEIRLLDSSDDIQLRKRIGILDEHFKFKIKPDNRQVTKGSIQLFCVENLEVNVSGNNVSAYVVKADEFTEIQLEADDAPPLRINVSVLPSGHNRELLLSLPFPSNGALLFNAEGEQVLFSAPLYLNNLMGYRVKVFVDQFVHGQKADLVFQLIDPELSNKDLKDLYMRREIVLGEEVSEFALYDWLQFIDSLMSVSSSLGSMVKVSLISSGRDVFSFLVHRYDSEMTASYDEGIIEIEPEILSSIKPDVLENIMVAAFNLNKPEQANVSLEPITSELALVGKWRFSPGTAKPSPWIIFPLEKSKLQFRPLLWYVGLPIETDPEKIEEVDTLPKAINIPDQELRYIAIRQVLQAMSVDLNHKSWSYLTSLWKKSSHLSMSTFDIWKIATSEAGFLACLLISGSNEIIEKLESDLPLIWELVRLEDWENALELYKEKITEGLGDDKELVRDLIRKKIEKIESLSLSMISIGKILQYKVLNERSPELTAMTLPISVFVKPQLDEAYQGLLRRQADNNWPIILSSYLCNKIKDLPKNYSHLLEVHQDHHRSAVFLPLVLAWKVLSIDNSHWPGSTVDLFKIQQLKEFDEDWFSTAFQYLSGWLSQQEDLGM